MITKVVHGWRVGGLIAYLIGPGRAEEHRRPRVIATWDGRDAAWQPAANGPKEWDLELGPLIRAVRAPVVAAGLPEQGGPDGKQGYVWHCAVRLAAADRLLSDTEWAGIARELLHGAGVAERDDPGGPRWVAIRHADDHIHIAVVLVRQDTGRRFWPYRDYPRLRETARELERRLGLTLTSAADGTAESAPSRGEREKDDRRGRPPARAELVRAIRRAAVAAHDVASFQGALVEAGYLVEIRYAPSGDPLGYKIARPGDVTAAGEPVFHSGSKLAADLSLPKLIRRWTALGEDTGDGAGEVLVEARYAVDQSRRLLVAADGDVDRAELAHAAGDVVVAAADLRLAGTTFLDAAAPFDRAVRPVRGGEGRMSAESVALRRVARRLVRRRVPYGPDEIAAAVALGIALVALAREIAAWQSARGRLHQAAAASMAADVVEAWSARWPVPAPAGRDVVAVPFARAGAEPRREPPAG